MSDLDAFRQETRAWLEANCPQSMRGRAVHFEDAYDVYNTDDARLWLERAAARGWVAPGWPKAYGGGGLSRSAALSKATSKRKSSRRSRQSKAIMPSAPRCAGAGGARCLVAESRTPLRRRFRFGRGAHAL